jgi:hypothetical protein
MACLPSFVPYKDAVKVTFTSAAMLAPGVMLDTGTLDFCMRWARVIGNNKYALIPLY